MSFLRKLFKKSSERNKFVIDNTVDILSPQLKDNITWDVPSVVLDPDSKLFHEWRKIPGAHKWHHYFPIYEKVFSDFKNKKLKILEIGVAKGASLKMWRGYFSNSTIVGVDIQEECQILEDINDRIFVRIGSQEDVNFLNKIIQEFGKFDIIIDDGSHVTSHMINSFNYLFLNGLEKNGLYFVEDTHSNYWTSHRDSHKSFMDLSKSLIDIMHYHYSVSSQEVNFRLNSKERIMKFKVPKLTTMIEEIRFFDSIVVIYKKEGITVPISEHL